MSVKKGLGQCIGTGQRTKHGRSQRKHFTALSQWDRCHKMCWSHQRPGSLNRTVCDFGELCFLLLIITTTHSDLNLWRFSYLWPWPSGPDRWTAVCAAGLPPIRGGLGAVGVSQVGNVGPAGPLDTLDLPRLLPSSTAPAAHPPLSHRPAGTTRERPAESTSSSSITNSDKSAWIHKWHTNCTIITTAGDSLCCVTAFATILQLILIVLECKSINIMENPI